MVETPPNTPVTISGLARRQVHAHGVEHVVNSTPVDMHCDRDRGLRRFAVTSKIYVQKSPQYEFTTYRCRNCKSKEKTFAVIFNWGPNGDAKVIKVGEYPPFSVPISLRVQKLLTKTDLELYRKGIRAIAQGLGIGAASYFRRVVEDQWSRLVQELRQAAKQLGTKDLSVYDKALRSTQFSGAVRTLKKAIPEKLLILDGQNPLTLLHRPLSKQIHQLTDQQCLQQAQDIQMVLEALLENIANVLKDQDELREAARRLRQG